MNTMMNDTEAAFKAAVDEINAAKTPGGPLPAGYQTEEVQAFVALAQRLADSIVEVYEQQLNIIAQKLEEAKTTAQHIRDITNERARDVADFRARVERFGTSLLDAHQTFLEKDTK